MTDSPKAARRRKRDAITVSTMIAMYCKGNHAAEARTARAHCGGAVCDQCAALDAYALKRTQNCRSIGEGKKKTCEECGNHCYTPEMREAVRAAMRWSGPRMMTSHPIMAVRHLLGK